MDFKTTGAPEIESERAYVVYDKRSGHIVHVHTVTTFRGGLSGSQDEDEARALVLARQFGHRPHGLRVLAVAPSELDLSLPQRVDLNTHRLIRTGVLSEDNDTLT